MSDYLTIKLTRKQLEDIDKMLWQVESHYKDCMNWRMWAYERVGLFRIRGAVINALHSNSVKAEGGVE